MRRFFVLAVLLACAAQSAQARAALGPPTFAYDARLPLDVRVVRVIHESTLTIEDVTFASPSGGRVRADIVLPPIASAHPGVLFVHWLGSVKTTNRTEFLSDARALAARGITSVLVDAMWAQPDWFDKVRKPETDYARSVQQVIDLRRALDLLAAQPNVDPHRLAYVGHDFGAMYGAVLSGVDPRPTCYVLMAGTTSFSSWYLLGTQPQDKAAYVAQMRPLDPPLFLARASARRFLFQFALKDQYVPVPAAERFASVAPGERAVLFYDADHGLASGEIDGDRLHWLETRLLR